MAAGSVSDVYKDFFQAGTIINGNVRDIQSWDTKINLNVIIKSFINCPIVVFSCCNGIFLYLSFEIPWQNRSLPSVIPIRNATVVASLKWTLWVAQYLSRVTSDCIVLFWLSISLQALKFLPITWWQRTG